MPSPDAAAGEGSAVRTTASERASTVGWVLRELRPVSFNFKDGPEAKYSRYGFVAQELQQVLPGVVRGQGEEHLKVAYQDLIALLTLAAQVLQEKVSTLEETVMQLRGETAAIRTDYHKLDENYHKLDEKLNILLSGQRASPLQQAPLVPEVPPSAPPVQPVPPARNSTQVPQEPQARPQEPQQQERQLRGAQEAREDSLQRRQGGGPLRDGSLPAPGLRHLQELEAKLRQNMLR